MRRRPQNQWPGVLHAETYMSIHFIQSRRRSSDRGFSKLRSDPHIDARSFGITPRALRCDIRGTSKTSCPSLVTPLALLQSANCPSVPQDLWALSCGVRPKVVCKSSIKGVEVPASSNHITISWVVSSVFGLKSCLCGDVNSSRHQHGCSCPPRRTG